MNWDKPIFIVACTNSGTKLLQSILKPHDEMTLFPVEPHYLGFGPNFVGRLNRNFALWPCFDGSRLTSRSELSLEKGDPSPKSFIQTLNHFFKSKFNIDPDIPPASETRPLIKEPKFSLRIPWILECFPDAKIICLVRNPWSCAEGIRRRQPMLGDLPLYIDIPTCTAQWSVANTIMRLDFQKDSCMFLKYEDMILKANDPRLWTDISNFLGLQKPIVPPDKTCDPDKFFASLKNLLPWEIDFISTFAADLIRFFKYELFLDQAASYMHKEKETAQ